MKRWILSFFLLFACILPASSHADADLSQRSGWPYAAVDTIQRAIGIVINYPDGTFEGWHPMDRFEFTVAIARGIAVIERQAPQPADKAFLHDNLSKSLRASPSALNALLALIAEFSPELIRLGQDVPKAQAILQTLQQQARQDVQDGKIVLTLEQLTNPFADVSHSDMAWQNRDQSTKAGIVGIGMLPVEDWPSSTIGTLPMTRLQMAQSLVRVLDNRQITQFVSQRLQQDPKALAAMQALVTEFTPELKLLGQEADIYQARLAELERTAPRPLAAKPFPDVPAGHWAAASVETLRLRGIVAGYPNATYAIPEGKR